MVNRNEVSTTKYIIKAKMEVDGVVEKPDVVGAIFGQTEGLLGSELDLRELQRTGRIGRIRVTIESHGGKSTGTIIIPSSLDKVETAMLAAALETVDRVGPCTAHVTLEIIEDVREVKRRKIVQRAADIIRKWSEEVSPESQQLTDEVLDAVRVAEITKYGSEELPAGPSVDSADELIIVEGRADVLNLLKNDINNVVAVGGDAYVVPSALGRGGGRVRVEEPQPDSLVHESGPNVLEKDLRGSLGGDDLPWQGLGERAGAAGGGKGRHPSAHRRLHRRPLRGIRHPQGYRQENRSYGLRQRALQRHPCHQLRRGRRAGRVGGASRLGGGRGRRRR